MYKRIFYGCVLFHHRKKKSFFLYNKKSVFYSAKKQKCRKGRAASEDLDHADKIKN